MRRVNSIIVLALLICTSSFFQNKRASARLSFRHGVDFPQLQVHQHWRSCPNALLEVEKKLGKCGLYLLVKAVTGNKESAGVQLRQKPSHESLTTLPSHFQEVVLSCLRQNYLFIHGFNNQDGCISHVEVSFQKSSVPRRYMADKSTKAPSDTPSEEDTITIPPELLFPSPPPPQEPAIDQSNFSKEHNRQVNKIITIAASVAGIVVVFSFLLFCCLTKGRKRFRDKQRDDRPLLRLSSNDFTAGSPTSPDIKDFGGNTSFSGSCLRPDGSFVRPDGSYIRADGSHSSSLAAIPEHGPITSGSAEALTSSEHSPGNSDLSPPPAAAAPPPPPNPKAQPPPPPKGVRPPPPPKVAGKGPHQRGRSTSGDGSELETDAPKTKLKPFFWDKVVGSPDHSMVWDEIRSGSFQFNEEMIESLFGYNPDDRRNGDRRGRASDASQPQYIQIIEPKKSQNLSILLKALNVTTEEVSDALLEGNELPPELLQTLLRMAPTQDEELKLRLFDGDFSLLGPAERFLKVMVGIPFAFKRMESLMFMMTYKEEVSSIKESFVTLEVACDELKKSRLFLKLLEAVLKTGNRMNDGTYRGGAQAFKLDTLLKLADVKGTDGKTTLLHFVVQEIIRAEGIKAVRATKENCSISSIKSDDFVEDPNFDATEQYRTLGLQVVSHISSDLENVKKAAVIDADGLTTTVSKLCQSLTKSKNFLNNEMNNSEEKTGFYLALVSFVEHSEGKVAWLSEEEKRISELVRKTADYFHGSAGKEEGQRLFAIVRDFLVMLDKICAQLKQSFSKTARNPGKETLSKIPSQDPPQSIQDMRQRLFPAIADRRVGDSSSDSDPD